MQSDTGRQARNKRTGGANPRLERGITLLEALITLLVMSVGLLGIAAMQVIGIQQNGSAFRHSQATWIAYDMADRMRANLNPAALDPYDAAASLDEIADHYKGISVSAGSTPSGQACGAGDSCTLQQMADFDSDQWRMGVMGLPNGAGTVAEDGTVGGRYRIRVMWDESTREIRSDSDNVAFNVQGCPSDMSITQTCVEIWVQP